MTRKTGRIKILRRGEALLARVGIEETVLRERLEGGWVAERPPELGMGFLDERELCEG